MTSSYRKLSNLLYLLVLFRNMASLNLKNVFKSKLRVMNGDPDRDNLFPFAVILLDRYHREYERGCTGSLISHVWVITAAHCIASYSSPALIMYGTTPNKTGSISKIQKAIKHPFFKIIEVCGPLPEPLDLYFENNKQTKAREVTRNDIALILVKKVLFNSFAKLSAIDHMSLIGHGTMYAGFGYTDIFETTSAFSKPLQVGEAAIKQCDKHLEAVPVICLNSKCGKHQIQLGGDSGGPLIYDGKLVGVCSMTNIYTAVSPYLTWIQDTMSIASNNGTSQGIV